MDDRDLNGFIEVMQEICHLYGDAKPMSPAQLRMYFTACAIWPLADVRQALSAHVRDETRGRFFPKPADIAAQLNVLRAADGRPSSGHAWALALKGNDEACTVYWTEEIAQALMQVKPVLDHGDRYGARKAFTEIYEGLVNQARQEGRPCKAYLSLGHDPVLRTAALEEARSQGRLSDETLLALEHDLKGQGPTEPPAHFDRDHPGVQMLLRWRERRQEERAVRDSEVIAERERVKAVKADIQRRVDQYAAGRTYARQRNPGPF